MERNRNYNRGSKIIAAGFIFLLFHFLVRPIQIFLWPIIDFLNQLLLNVSFFLLVSSWWRKPRLLYWLVHRSDKLSLAVRSYHQFNRELILMHRPVHYFLLKGFNLQDWTHQEDDYWEEIVGLQEKFRTDATISFPRGYRPGVRHQTSNCKRLV